MPKFVIFTATKYDQRPVVRALYSYLASGENQLTFHEHDRIALVGDRAKGWQFGENLRTQLFGWFPVAYTELEVEESHSNWGATPNGGQQQQQQQNGHGRQTQASQHHKSAPQNSYGFIGPGPLDRELTRELIREEVDVDELPESSLDSTLIEEDEDDDVVHSFTSKQYRRVSNNANGSSSGHSAGHNGLTNGGNTPKPGPPPTLPAPIPMMPSR